MTRRGLTSAAAFAGYCAISFLYLGTWVVAHPGQKVIGRISDTNPFIWSMGWWPHALLHGEDPIYTHVIWAPRGIDLAWVTSIPGLSLPLAPLKLLFGPVVAYNVAAALLPALAAWTGFLLCRYLTSAVVPSLLGGYLFGFSTYILGQADAGHLNFTAVFLIPLVALVFLQYLDRRIESRALALRVGLLLAAQFTFSTEVFATLTVALAVALAIALCLVPAVPNRLRSAAAPLAAAYLIAAILVSPLLYYILTDFRSGSFLPVGDYSSDLLNLVVPTPQTAVAGDAASGISRHFPANEFEQGAYFGLPTLAIITLFIVRHRGQAAGRFLIASFAAGLLAALGTALFVDGHRLVPLPWWLLARLPALDKVLPMRMIVYPTLAAASTVALWAASKESPRWLRVILPALAVLALVPNLEARRWDRPLRMPTFFAAGGYKACLASGENDLIIPYNYLGDSLVWQAVAGFHFRMAQGEISEEIPAAFARYGTPLVRLLHDDIRQGDGRTILPLVRGAGVSTILVDQSDPWPWADVLAGIAKPKRVGGMLLYRVGPGLVTDAGCISD